MLEKNPRDMTAYMEHNSTYDWVCDISCIWKIVSYIYIYIYICVCIIFRLIWNQMVVHMIPNQPQMQSGKYNLISIWLNKIYLRVRLCVHETAIQACNILITFVVWFIEQECIYLTH